MMLFLAFILAISEEAKFTLTCVHVFVSGATAIVLGVVVPKWLGMQSELKATAKELVKAELATQTLALETSIAALVKEMESVRQRLADGDNQIDGLGDKNHGIELKLKDQTMVLQKWMLENFASREDLRHMEGKIETAAKEVVELRVQMAGTAGSSGGGRKGGA